MNITYKTKGGGIFSHFQGVIQSLGLHPSLDTIENVFVNVDTDNPNKAPRLPITSNFYNSVLEQNEEYTNITPIVSLAVYRDIFTDNLYPQFQKAASKIKLHQNIIQRIPENIGSDTLGIHIRLTDMNTCHHTQYGFVHIEQYLEVIHKQKGNYNNIFVASDNEQSLMLIKNEFNNIIHNDVSNRATYEEDPRREHLQFLRSQINNETFWHDSFVEMASLSKCGYLIYRVSNLSNCALCFSNTITGVTRL